LTNGNLKFLARTPTLRDQEFRALLGLQALTRYNTITSECR
jgi:hypothetical protein